MIVDTHAHLEMLKEIDKVIESSRREEIGLILTVADAKNPASSIEISNRFKEVYLSVGLHPHDASYYSNKIKKNIINTLRNKKAVCLGEIGLDYYYMNSPRNKQTICFENQLELAVNQDIPVCIHIRDAYEDAYKIISSYPELKDKILLHCFSMGREEARSFLDLGCYISFAGNVTFPKADRIREAVEVVPIDRILVETDSPFLAPQERRGKPNRPSYVKFVAERISEIKGLEYREFSQIIVRNARKFFSVRI